MTIIDVHDTAAVVRLLASGAVGVMPTDTVYGIVAHAANQQAVARLYQAKHRQGKPGTVIAADTQQLCEIGIDPEELALVAHYWPNPLSVVLSDQPGLEYLDQGKRSLAVRIPNDPAIHALLVQTGALLTSSANQPGQPPAISLQEAQAYFGDRVDFYVDGGSLQNTVPSTIIRLSAAGTVEVLRQGALIIAK
jgi:L-threonylcarbamoyladenylate synthase